MAHYIETPRTDAVDRTRYTIPDLSEIQSFVAPAGGDDLLNAMRNGKNNTFATPSARAPLASRSRNAQAKNEFTPLLKSAAKNRYMRQDKEAKENHGGLTTPAALKAGYKFSSPAMPDTSSIVDVSMSDDNTPLAPVDSSSAMSTPMALPRRGDMGMAGDGGNVLTLREQEAVSDQLDHHCDCFADTCAMYRN
jgi:hypothetical protein